MKKKTILAACIKKKVLFASEDELNRHLRHLAERRIEFFVEDRETNEDGTGTQTIRQSFTEATTDIYRTGFTIPCGTGS